MDRGVLTALATLASPVYYFLVKLAYEGHLLIRGPSVRSVLLRCQFDVDKLSFYCRLVSRPHGSGGKGKQGCMIGYVGRILSLPLLFAPHQVTVQPLPVA